MFEILSQLSREILSPVVRLAPTTLQAAGITFPVQKMKIRKGKTWAIAVRRGSYESLSLLNSGCFSRERWGNSVLNFWFA